MMAPDHLERNVGDANFSTRSLLVLLSLVCLTLSDHWRPTIVARSDEPRASADLAGEPESLPAGALQRLGTIRFRQEGAVTQIAYSPDGTSLATTSGDTVIIFDANSGLPKRRLESTKVSVDVGSIACFCFSPDGAEIASLSNGRVIIWDVETGRRLLIFKHRSDEDPFGNSGSMAYSPDGLKLAIPGGTAIVAYDTSTGQEAQRFTLPGQQSSFNDVTWSKDGKYLISVKSSTLAVAWNSATGQVERTFELGDNGHGTCVTLSEDQSLLAVASIGEKPTITIWDFQNQKKVKEIDHGEARVRSLFFADGERTLVAGSIDRIQIWDVMENKRLHDIAVGGVIAVDAKLKRVASSRMRPTIRQWDILTGEEVFPQLTRLGHMVPIECVAYSPQGKWIATGGTNAEIHIWDAETGRHHARIPTEHNASRLAFDSSGSRLFSFSKSLGAVRVWDIGSGKIVQAFDSEPRARAFALSADSQTMVTIGSNAQGESLPGEDIVHVWNVVTGRELHAFPFKTASTESAVLMADMNILLTGSENGEILVMDLTTGQNLQLLLGHQHRVTDLKLDSDARRLISASCDQTLRIWDTATWRTTHILKGHARAVTSVAISPNGKLIASGSGARNWPVNAPHSHRIRLWDAETGKQVGFLMGHHCNTTAVAFSPDGTRLVSAHENTTALIWDVLKGVPNE